MVKLEDFYSKKEWNAFNEIAQKHQTPFLIINTEIVQKNYNLLSRYFPYAEIFYAIKANSEIPILKILKNSNSNFDIASIEELNLLLDLGILPDKISYGNVIKKKEDIKMAYEKGIRLFVTDSLPDLENIAKEAPKSKVFCRILLESSKTADWPLSKKFGCDPQMAIDLLKKAKKMRLVPYGISFHVGSQQRNIKAWKSAIQITSDIFKILKKEGILLHLINMGGGFPAQYTKKNPPLSKYAEKITCFLHHYFGNHLPRVIIEPGRSLAAEAGVLVSEIIQITKKSFNDKYKWLYLDAGIYNGLFESINESIKYPIYSTETGKNTKSYILAGPTCDSTDILYEKKRPLLPNNLKPKQRLFFLSCGAYSANCSMVSFNGFKPLNVYFCHSEKEKD